MRDRSAPAEANARDRVGDRRAVATHVADVLGRRDRVLQMHEEVAAEHEVEEPQVGVELVDG